MSEHPRIFVQIASYRDRDLQWTVKDMFETAEKPERVFAGVCWQLVPEEDRDSFAERTRPEQLRILEVQARDSKGVCWARHETQKLWRGEEFTLQIDSHMRFERGWDQRLLDQMKLCGSARSVLTTYPMGFTPPREITHPGIITKIVAKEFDRDRILTFRSQTLAEANAPPRPTPTAFFAAGFAFGPSTIIADVPYDPYLYFYGEEVSMAVRLWTHGYDLYCPNRVILYHDWSRKGRHIHWEDKPNNPAATLNERALARVRHLFGTEPSADPEVLKDIDKYGFGSARSLADYERFTGISFANKTIPERAKSFYFPFASKEQAEAAARSGPASGATPAPAKPLAAPALVQASSHKPRKTLETEQVIVYDDFLAPHLFEKAQAWALHQDYQHINTTGQISKVWRLHDGFPLRGMGTAYYVAGALRDDTKAGAYPCNTAFDFLIEQIMRTLPEVKHLVGSGPGDWNHFSVSSFLYPRGTGLSLHKDGRGTYSGAYTYFLTPVWNIHWGGLLMVLDKRTVVPDHYVDIHGRGNTWKPIWIDQEFELALSYEPGLAISILPLPNRIVFIDPDCHHMITTVTPAAGDHVRAAWSGFFVK
jgi:hypothetical protein